MKCTIQLIVAEFSRMLSKESRDVLFIGKVDILRFMVYVQKIEEQKMRNIDNFKNNMSK